MHMEVREQLWGVISFLPTMYVLRTKLISLTASVLTPECVLLSFLFSVVESSRGAPM